MYWMFCYLVICHLDFNFPISIRLLKSIIIIIIIIIIKRRSFEHTDSPSYIHMDKAPTIIQSF